MKRFKIILVALVAATMIQAVPITANAKTNKTERRNIFILFFILVHLKLYDQESVCQLLHQVLQHPE